LQLFAARPRKVFQRPLISWALYGLEPPLLQEKGEEIPAKIVFKGARSLWHSFILDNEVASSDRAIAKFW